jgi:hypothetical protein
MSNVFHLPITEHTNRIAGPIACGQLCQRLGFYLALVAKQRNCASLPPVRPPDRAALESMKWRDALVVCWAYKLYRRGLFGNPIGVYLYLSEGALLKQGAGGAAFRQVRRVPSRAIGCSKSSFFLYRYRDSNRQAPAPVYHFGSTGNRRNSNFNSKSYFNPFRPVYRSSSACFEQTKIESVENLMCFLI